MNIYGCISCKGTKILRKGFCTKFEKIKSMTVSDATLEADGLKDFFKSVDRSTVNFGKKVANNPIRDLEIANKIGSSAATRIPRAPLAATLDLNKFAKAAECINVIQK